MQISLQEHLDDIVAAIQRMGRKNDHRRVLEVSYQILIQQAQALNAAQAKIAELEAERNVVVLTDGHVGARPIVAGNPNVRVGLTDG